MKLLLPVILLVTVFAFKVHAASKLKGFLADKDACKFDSKTVKKLGNDMEKDANRNKELIADISKIIDKKDLFLNIQNKAFALSNKYDISRTVLAFADVLAKSESPCQGYQISFKSFEKKYASEIAKASASAIEALNSEILKFDLLMRQHHAKIEGFVHTLKSMMDLKTGIKSVIKLRFLLENMNTRVKAIKKVNAKDANARIDDLIFNAKDDKSLIGELNYYEKGEYLLLTNLEKDIKEFNEVVITKVIPQSYISDFLAALKTK